MPLAIAALAGGAALGAGGSLFAGNQQQDAFDSQADALQQLAQQIGIPPEELLYAIVNPNIGNPALSGATTDILTQLGQPTGGVGLQGSPESAALNAAAGLGLDQGQMDKVSKGLATAANISEKLLAQGFTGDIGNQIKKKIGKDAWMDVKKAINLAGWSHIGDFFRTNADFKTQARTIEQQAAAIAPTVQQGRLGALETIARVQGDFPIASAEDLLALEARETDRRFRQIEENRQFALDETAQRANVLGFNPGRTFGEIEEQTLQSKADVQDTQALARAIQLLQGAQGQASTGLSSLQTSLNAPNQLALQSANLTSQGTQTLGQLAAQQAMALNQLAVRQDENRTNLLAGAIGANTQGNLAQSQGTQGAFNAFANPLTALGTAGVVNKYFPPEPGIT